MWPTLRITIKSGSNPTITIRAKRLVARTGHSAPPDRSSLIAGYRNMIRRRILRLIRRQDLTLSSIVSMLRLTSRSGTVSEFGIGIYPSVEDVDRMHNLADFEANTAAFDMVQRRRVSWWTGPTLQWSTGESLRSKV